jgi:hypothetical protein
LAAAAAVCLSSNGCAVAVDHDPSPGETAGASAEAVGSSAEALNVGSPDNLHYVDVGFGIQRLVDTQCPLQCIAWKPNPKHKPGYQLPPFVCAEWGYRCGGQEPAHGSILFADKSAYPSTPFPAYPGGDWKYEGCGPQAALNVLHYFGAPVRIFDVAPYIHTINLDSSDIATLPEDLSVGLQNAANSLGNGHFSTQRLSNIDVRGTVRNELAMGNPVIALVHNGSHYQVITGLVDDQYHVIDYQGNDSWVSESNLGLEIFGGAWSAIGTCAYQGYCDDTVITIHRTP